VYCGIDWAEKHHDIALVDADGQLVAKRRINETGLLRRREADEIFRCVASIRWRRRVR
jgi:hypothetical protein